MAQITVHNLTFPIPHEYRAGHTLTEWEASALQRIFMRNLSKSLYKVCSSANSEERESVGRLHVSEFIDGFRNGHDRMRAVRTEARRIALTAIEARQYKRGQTLRDLSSLELEDMTSRLANSESIRAEALKRVDSVQRIAHDIGSTFFASANSDDEHDMGD